MTDNSKSKDAATEGKTLGGYARIYDLFAGAGYRARQVLKAWPPLPGDLVLDVGCGPGSITLVFKRAVGAEGEVAGIDASAKMIAQAQRNARKRGEGVNFQVAAIEKLPFENAHFDKAYATLMTHHLPPQTKNDGFREVYRVLKPGGGFLITDMGPPTGLPARVVWLPLLLAEKYIFSGNPSIEPHLKGKIPEMLKEAGFSDARIIKKSFGILEYLLAIK